MTTKNTTRTMSVTALAALFVATGLMAGCMGLGSNSATKNEAPHADLKASRDVAWNGDTIRFDATKSKDPDGNITSWRFDFGDNTTMEVKREQDANVTHTYTHGGEYTVTVTVLDNGKDEAGALSDTDSVTLAVDERDRVAGGALYATPAGTNQTADMSQAFTTYHGVDRTEVNVTVTSLLLAGSSRVTIRIVGPDGHVIIEKPVTVDAGQTKTELLQAAIARDGPMKVEMHADSGGAQVSGEARFYYDAGYAGSEMTSSPSPTSTA